MNLFKLAPQLEKDCYVLGRLTDQNLLLLNNALLPWLILVPETDVTELFELDQSEQHKLLDNINRLSAFLKQYYPVDKLNIAAIGNIVSQLHVHIIARSRTDFCWPDVVWGRPEKTAYTDEDVEEIKDNLIKMFGNKFIVS